MENLIIFLSDLFSHQYLLHMGSHQNIQLTKNLYSIISHLTKTNAELDSSTTTKTVISGQENQTNTRCINKKLHREKGHGFKKNFS